MNEKIKIIDSSQKKTSEDKQIEKFGIALQTIIYLLT